MTSRIIALGLTCGLLAADGHATQANMTPLPEPLWADFDADACAIIFAPVPVGG